MIDRRGRDILPYHLLIIVPVLAFSFLANGAIDLWAQTILHLFLFTGAAAAFWFIFPILHNKELPAWILLLSVLAIATAFSGACFISRETFLLWVDYFLIFTLAGSLIRSEVHFLRRVLSFFGLFLSLAAIVESALLRHPPKLTLLNPNILAGCLLIFIFLAADEFCRNKNVLDGASAAAALAALLLTRSFGAIFAAAAGSAYLAFRTRTPNRADRLSRIMPGFFLVIIFCLVYWQIKRGWDWHRLAWWQGALVVIRQHPFLGLGPGTYEHAMSFLHLPLRTWFAHNTFLQFAAESGTPSLFCLVFIIGSLFRKQTYPIQAGIVAVLAHNLVDYSLSIPAVSFLFWIMLGMNLDYGLSPSANGTKERLEKALIISLLFSAAWTAWAHFKADQACTQAVYAFQRGLGNEGEHLLRKSLQWDSRDSKIYAVKGNALYNDATARKSRAELQEALAWMLEAVRKEPINSHYYRSALQITRELGLSDMASELSSVLEGGKIPKHAAF
jgi:O-antigen ligase